MITVIEIQIKGTFVFLSKYIDATDASVANKVLAMTKDIASTYKTATTDAKRAYLRFFFDKIYVEDKKIVRVEYKPVIEVLNRAKLGILSINWLPRLDSNQ